ncbi:uracil nucleotide/cysteinyl leukotriene receptor-like [Puntigrus tetrazona]|uniref:uracil nucleotide/cysteinyl leukotriene receptor-like n=1 Tax=Puntigrus tetrazona TaxID=1606681 RepID=UPI001C8A4EB4|nr:uracil nucleotide/cysteinyl leukotriene receptor-like [Puntigrus tetrazona]
MNNSTDNFTRPEASSAPSFVLVDILEMCVCAFSFLVGLPIHLYVLWLTVTGTECGVALLFFKLNLCVCEIGICVESLIFILSFWFSSLTKLICFLIGLAVTGRPLFQCLICVERYLAVVHPVTFLKYKPLRYRVICCSVVWIIILGSCFFSEFIPPYTIAHTWFFSVQFLLFLSIQLFCLVAVLRALKQSGPGERVREKEEENHMKRRAFHFILICTVNTAIIYVPYILAGFFTILIKQNIYALWCICLFCYLLAGFVQPVLYLHRFGKLSCLSSFQVC